MNTAKMSEPGPRRLRLAILLLEGYLYLALVFGAFFAALALFIWAVIARRPLLTITGIFVAAPVLTTTAAALRALYFRVPEPQGMKLNGEDAPALYALVEDVRRRIGAPRVHEILIGRTANAAAMQLSRFVLFPRRNILTVGYPLLVALSVDQLRAVIAHELGHFCFAHGRFAAWVYRTRLSWQRVVQTLHARGAAPIFVYWLDRWYMPRLWNLTTAVARAQEFVADRCAADAAGSRNTADALVVIDWRTRFLEQTYWPALQLRWENEEAPPGFFAGLEQAFREKPLPDDGELDILLSEDNCYAVHPSLRARLQILGEEPRVPAPVESGAGHAVLGGHMQTLAAQLDREWYSEHAETLRERRSTKQQNRNRLRELEALECPSAEEMLEKGRLLESLEDPDAALAAFLVAHAAGSPDAALAAAALLIDQSRADEAEPLIESVMAAGEKFARAGCDMLVSFYEGSGRLVDAERYRSMSKRYATRAALAQAEQSTLTALDRFVPHGLETEEVARLISGLAREPRVSSAFLARREFRYASGGELVLGVVTASGSTPDVCSSLRSQRLLRDDVRVVLLDEQRFEVRNLLAALPGSRVYDIK